MSVNIRSPNPEQRPPLKRRLLWIAPLMVFVALAGVLYRQLGVDPTVVTQARVGKPLPAFQLTDLLSNEVRTRDQLPQEPFLLNVWGSWCPTCRMEQPTLVKLRDQVAMVGMNYKDEPADALRFLSRYGNPFRMTLADQQGQLGLDLGVTGAPETFVVDGQGRVRLHTVGALTEDIYEARIAPCLEALRQAQHEERCA